MSLPKSCHYIPTSSYAVHVGGLPRGHIVLDSGAECVGIEAAADVQ